MLTVEVTDAKLPDRNALVAIPRIRVTESLEMSLPYCLDEGLLSDVSIN